MKFWQYVLGTGAALLLFASAMVAENTRYSAVSEAQEKSIIFTAPQERTTEDTRDIFFPNGEMIRIFDDSDVALDQSLRRLKQGKVFLGGTFFPDESDTPLTNTFSVGSATVDYTGSNALIVRRQHQKETDVYAVNHPIRITFFPDEKVFSLPSGMALTFDDGFSPTEQPYHIQKKELRVRPFGSLLDPERRTPEEDILNALIAHHDFRAEFRANAWDRMMRWDFVGLAQKIRSFTVRNAFFVTQAKKDRLRFDEMVAPLLEARRLVERQQLSQASEKLEIFRDTLQSAEWKALFSRDSSLAQDWRFFAQAQKIWLPITAPDRPEEVFVQLWEPEEKVRTSLSEVELIFWNTELYASNYFLRESKEHLRRFQAAWESIEFTPEDRPWVSRMRRQVSALLQAYGFLREEAFFALREQMIDTEMSLIPAEDPLRKSIALETGINTLHFLATARQKTPKSPVIQQLVRIWTDRNVQTLAEEASYHFSPPEREEIRRIDLGVSADVSQEEIEQFQEVKEAQQKLESELIEAKETPESLEPKFSKTDIQNAKQLWEFLNESGIFIERLNFRSTRTESQLESRFWEGDFLGQETSGVFDYLAQRFVEIQIGEEREENVPRNFLETWLKSMAKVLVVEEAGDSPEEAAFSSALSQRTPSAILARHLMEKKLSKKGLELDRENIEMLDEGAQNFHIHRARYRGLQLEFEVQKDLQQFSVLTITQQEQTEGFSAPMNEREFFALLERILEKK
ncbi:MAG: hypothetical protein K9M51_02245 [Candidatus Gracilibacteria bacterium]|nr:hypothetical protein [Candidatus Gracilibacteria bacterium]